MSDYIPSRDADVLSFAQNFSSKITAVGNPYGIDGADAAILAAQVDAYNTALTLATEPDTRTKPTIAAKKAARTELVGFLRGLARRIQANPVVTNAQKLDIGLHVRDSKPSPVPPPATLPLVSMLEVRHGSHVIRLADETSPSSRARPEGVDGAEVYVFVGDTPPAEIQQWRLYGLATRADYEIQYPAEDAGKQAHIAARWFNPRGQVGPASVVISERIAA